MRDKPMVLIAAALLSVVGSIPFEAKATVAGGTESLSARGEVLLTNREGEL